MGYKLFEVSLSVFDMVDHIFPSRDISLFWIKKDLVKQNLFFISPINKIFKMIVLLIVCCSR